jgi:hypothetical protein
LVLVRDGTDRPQLGLTRVTLDPATPATTRVPLETPTNAAPFRLLGFGPDTGTLPPLPSGMTNEAGLLQVLEGQGVSAWTATLTSSTNVSIPGYVLPGFIQRGLLRAATSDHHGFTTVVSAPNAWPNYLLPPELASVPVLPIGGGALTWPAVVGASLYVARLYAQDVPDPPIWEGATAGTRLVVPAGVIARGQGYTLQIDAWDAPGVTVYSVADIESGPRRLVLPEQPPGLTGRHSWAVREFPGL